MTDERTPIKRVWMERAQVGYLQHGAKCVKTRRSHVLKDNKTEVGLAVVCMRCGAGLAVKRPLRDIVEDRVQHDSDLRAACWMCGSPFSSPRTKDEYLQQMCAACLVAIERAGLLKLQDPRTREVGGQPPVSAHLRQ